MTARHITAIIIAIFLLHNHSLAQNTNDHAEVNVGLTYKTPSSQNGLEEAAFNVTAIVVVNRGVMSDKRTHLLLSIKAQSSTSNNPSPSFLHSYRYNGILYGNQHVGYEAFNGIKAMGVFDVIVQGPNINWSGTMTGPSDVKKISTELPTGADARDYYVSIKVNRVGYFMGTVNIENKIREIIKSQEQEKAEKDKLAKAAALKSEADRLLAAGDYQGAKNKLQTAKQMAPNDNSLDEQIRKTEAKETEALTRKESAAKKPISSGSGVSSKPGTSAPAKTSGSSTNSSSTSGGRSDNTEDDFWEEKKSQPAAVPAKKSDSEILAEYHETVRKSDEARQQQADAFKKKLDVDYELATQSFYAANALKSNRDRLDETTTLRKNHSSIEELEAEFEQNFRRISQIINEETALMNQKLKANMEYQFRNGSENDKALGEVVYAAGSLINDLSEEKRKREAREKLARQRDKMKQEMEVKRAAMLAEMAAKRKAMIIDFRKGLLSEFSEGGLPLSSYNVKQNVLYFFSYHIEESTIQNDSPKIYLSNVFPVGRYADGSWPFKNTLVSELSSKASGKTVLMGYYGTEELAAKSRNAFISMARKCEFKLENIQYKGKNTAGVQGSNDDFWETGKAKGKPVQNKPKRDDFWDK
jgi:hypothetical protein